MAYTGAKVAIPIGQLGFVNIANMSKTPIEGAIQAEGLEFIEGSVQREPGNVLYLTFPVNFGFLDGIEFYPIPGLKELIVFGWDVVTGVASLYKSTNDGVPIAINTVLSVSQRGSHFLVGGAESANRPKKVFFFNGINPVQVNKDVEDFTTALSKPPADWNSTHQPFFGIMHRNRVWAGGNDNDPHRIYVSKFDDHEDFLTENYSISIFPGEGDGLVGGYSFNGRLFLFKRPHGIYWVDDTSTEVNDWGIKKLVDTVGLANPNCICETETDLLFLDPSPALYSLSTVQEFGEVRPRSLLDEFGVDRWLKDNFYKATPQWTLYTIPKLTWHNDKRQAILTYQKDADLYGKLTLDYRFSPVKIGYSFRDRIRFSLIVTASDGKLRHVHGEQHKLYMGDQENRSVASINGGPWVSKYQIPHMNLAWADSSLTGTRVGLEWLTIEATIFAEQNVLVDVFLDGTFKYTLNFLFSNALSGFILDNSQLDVDALGGASTYTRTKRLRGSCERFSLIFYTNHPTANFIINDILLLYRPNEARLRKKP